VVEGLQGFDLSINTAIIQVPQINANKRMGYEVNVLGTQSICDAVENIDSIKGLLHASSWHVFGETSIRGVLNEEFGYHPDKIEDRARFYALCKIAQESVVRLMGEMSSKSYGIIRLGTVLGDSMPKQTAANVFVENSLAGLPLTPFSHTQHRPMIYVDVRDVCRAFESFASMIFKGQIRGERSAKVVDLFASPPISIIDLARIIRARVISLTHGAKRPKIEVIDKGIKPLYSPKDKQLIKIDTSEARRFLGLKKFLSPSESIEQILKDRLGTVD
jgi:nucleoside-diphosphate-sugar epimerase